MTRDQAARRLESERVRISHDLFQNGFGGILQPGWRDERLTEADVVLRALQGDPECIEIVQSAISFWTNEVSPPLSALIGSVSKAYGFVTTAAWDQEVCRVKATDETIRNLFQGADARKQAVPLARAAAFWEACDSVGRFLTDLRKRSSEFFLRWDPQLIADESEV